MKQNLKKVGLNIRKLEKVVEFSIRFVENASSVIHLYIFMIIMCLLKFTKVSVERGMSFSQANDIWRKYTGVDDGFYISSIVSHL